MLHKTYVYYLALYRSVFQPIIKNRVVLFIYILLMTSSGLISCSCVLWSPWFNICYHFQGNIFITFCFWQTVLEYLKNRRQTVRSRWLILCKQRSILPTNSFNFYNFVQNFQWHYCPKDTIQTYQLSIQHLEQLGSNLPN